MALKLLKTKVLHTSWDPRFGYVKRHRRLPVVLSKSEITQILAHIPNEKHRLLIALTYGAGLRVSEITHLRAHDIDWARHMIVVRAGKGTKDRMTLLPETLVPVLRQLADTKASTAYVFESERGGCLTSRTAQAIFAKALERSGIQKPATFHSLRHSFATHLLNKTRYLLDSERSLDESRKRSD
jgi:site-specific recombinase XerD